MPSLFPYLHRWLVKPNTVWTSKNDTYILKSFSLRKIEALSATSSVRGWEENTNTFCYGSVKWKHICMLTTICEYELFFILFKLKVCYENNNWKTVLLKKTWNAVTTMKKFKSMLTKPLQDRLYGRQKEKKN